MPSATVDHGPMTPFLLPTLLAEQLDAHEFAALTRDYLLLKQGYAKRGVDYGGLTSVLAPPVVAPARVRFKDTRTGEWIEGVSEPKIDLNSLRMELDVRAYEPCRKRAHHGLPQGCLCEKELTGIRQGPTNLLTNVWANLFRVAILGTNTTVSDTGAVGRALTKTMDGGVASLLGCAGTGTTTAAVVDTNLQTQTESQATVTVNTVTGATTTGTFTTTFTITAGAPRAYAEVGLKAITTTTAWNFLLCHDVFSALNVSTSGTLAVTYTFTSS